jgi:uncharacterized protein (TIGR02271 family)
MSSTNNIDNIDWNDVVKKEAIGIDGLDLGIVHEVGDTYIITQKGLLNKKRYHIPISSIQSFDGDILKMGVNETELDGYEEDGGQKFEGYSSFKSSDMSKELETKIPVMGENLDVSKRLTENKVKIIKMPVKEIKKVDIELTHEEITIERIPAKNDLKPTETIENPVQSKTEIIIQLKREEPVVTKTPYVKEEVIIKKKPITETKTITEDVTTENINYNNKANQKVEEINNNQNHEIV